MAQLQRCLFVVPPLLTLAACSGGGGGGSDGGTISGLSAPSAMEIITVEEASSLVAPGAQPPTSSTPNFDANSDYATDAARNHVWDPAIEPISMINEILCYLGQTGAEGMVNQGAYNAQIDEAKCRAGSDPSASSQGQSSASNGVQPAIWVVESTRASNDAPQVVHAWVPQDHDGQSATIFVSMTVHSGVTDATPFGEFVLNFAGAQDFASIGSPMMWGTLQSDDQGSGEQGYVFYQSEGDINQVPNPGERASLVAVTVSMSADGTTGQARLSVSYRQNDPMNGDSGIVSEEYLLDMDANEVLRQIGSDPAQCYSRTQFHYNTFRYNLYHASGPNAGERVALNSGFPIRTADGSFGWLGYWGLWVPPSTTVEHGDVVTRQEFGSNATEDYTILMAPGKLVKFTRNTLDLLDGDGKTFDWFDFQSMPPTRYLVELDQSQFFRTASWDDQSMTWTTLGSPDLIDTSTYGFLNMYSQGLGGPVGYVHGDAFLTYFAQEFVNGSSALFNGVATGTPVELYGYSQCLRSGITGAEAEMGDVYLSDSGNVNAPYVFQIAADDLTLFHDVNGDDSLLTQVGLADGEEPANGPYTWGMRSGPMVTDTAGIASPWDLWNKDVFYQYETGHNAWNQLTTALDSNGDCVVFDPPLQFSYTHATANDKNGDSTYDGQMFQLNYSGPGDLHGIPHEGVDFNNDGNPDRWFPLFSIADGTLCGPTGSEYVIRGIEAEITLVEVLGGCASLDVANASVLTLPTSADYTAPDSGDKPTVDEPPAVIEGVKQ
ncbi:MAG: hypothetical protein IT454_16685 [Planctomycetes bacterium]|nr:hypothetical protein [Planctomycetota bacterium]